MSYEMKTSSGDTVTGEELNRITKVAYRPEKNKDCLVVWQEIGGVLFERSYHYENYNDAKEDFMNIRDLVEMKAKEEILNEGW